MSGLILNGLDRVQVEADADAPVDDPRVTVLFANHNDDGEVTESLGVVVTPEEAEQFAADLLEEARIARWLANGDRVVFDRPTE